MKTIAEPARQRHAAWERQATKEQAQASPPPPVAIYLPGLSIRNGNSGRDLAVALADHAGHGPGTFTVETLSVPSDRFADCSRIVRDGTKSVLDVCTLDYRPRLGLAEIAGTGVGAATRRFAAALRIFVRAALLLLPAGKRAKAKGEAAKWQLFLGIAAALLLFLSVLFTGFALLVSLGLLQEPAAVNSNLADAIAVGGAALSTYLLLRIRPVVREATRLIEELHEYIDDQRRAASVGRALGPALDDLLEKHPERSIRIVGYSLGSLVAIDYLFPPASLHVPYDARLKAVTSLVTVGCPLDFVRLYRPEYVEKRDERVASLAWTNIFIPADLFGSNFLDDADVETDVEEEGKGTLAGGLGPSQKRPVSVRYTDRKLTFLNAWTRTGFRAHSQYWRTDTEEGCSALVASAINVP
jgi:hypothetical protein